MREIHPTAQNIREHRNNHFELPMVYLEPRHRDDPNVVERIGFWRGPDNTVIQIRDMVTGGLRNVPFYKGLYSIESVRWTKGFDIQSTTISLNSTSPQIQYAFRELEPMGCNLQAFKRVYDPLTRVPIAVEPWFMGLVDAATFTRSSSGQPGSLEVEIVSIIRTLTYVTGYRKSHERQFKRNGDMIRQYKRSVKDWDVPWGAKNDRD